MIVVELSGGMGNQMFQYAFGRYLALKHDTELLLDTHYLLDRNPKRDIVFRNYDLSIFNIKASIAPNDISKEYGYLRSPIIKAKQKLIKPKKLQIIVEKNMEFISNFDALPNNLYLKGYWQNFRYFESISNIIKEDFSFIQPIGENCIPILNKIKNCNSVCLNVRRTDFINNSTHKTLDSNYYKKAEQIISKSIKNPVFFVFSDDIEWCKKNINPDYETHFIEHEYAGEKFKDYLNLMSNCKHFIIPNSSFALWAAWFSTNKDKEIILPEFWLYNPIIKTEEVFNHPFIKIS